MGCIPKKTSRQVLQPYSLCKGWLPDNYLKITWQLPDKLSVKLFPKKFHEIFCKTVPEIVLEKKKKIQTRPHPCYILTDCGTYPQLPTQPKKIVQVQTNTVVFYGHPELSGEEKSKFEFEEKKFSIVLKMEICWVFKPQTSIFSTILNFFSSNSNFDFSSPDNSGWP